MSKVLILASYAPSLLDFRGDLIKSIADRGHRVLACAPGISSDLSWRLAALGAATRELSMARTGINPFADFNTIRNLIAVFREEAPELVLAYTVKPILYGALAARMSGIPGFYALITGLGYAAESGQRGQHILSRIVRLAYRMTTTFCRGVFFQNPDDRDFFISSRLLTHPNKAVVLNGSGINLDEFAPTSLPDAPAFLMIARLLRAKGVREYIIAARQTKTRCPNAQFRLIGWFDDGPDAISRVEFEHLNFDHAVEMLGPRDDVRPDLANARIYVLPSYREGMPRTVLEAMSMGRPIITTDVPGCRETVTHGYNGYVVPPEDPISLAEAMSEMLEDSERALSMGRKSRQIAEQRFDVRKVNRQMIEVMGL